MKLGVATKRDLAQLCAEVYSPNASVLLWITAEVAIAACDLAEVIGSAIALQLLVGLPLVWGTYAQTYVDRAARCVLTASPRLASPRLASWACPPAPPRLFPPPTEPSLGTHQQAAA